MFRAIQKAKKNQKGFTLVELMVTVLIIGILIMIAIPSYNAVVARAETRACEANRRMIDGAIVQWRASNDLGIDAMPDETEAVAFWSDYFEETPECPTADANSYTLATTGTTCSSHPEVVVVE